MSEDIYGLIWTYHILYQGQTGGYALTVTSERVLGAKKSATMHSLVVYLGPHSKATDEQKAQAEQITRELIGNHEFEIRKESVTRIDWHQEGFLSPGYFRFTTTTGPIQIDTVRRAFGNEGVIYTDRQLIGALLMFAPDVFYNEKRGVLVAKEVNTWLQNHKDWRP